MVQQSRFKYAVKALLVFGFSFLLVSCSVASEPKTAPYVELVSDGIFGKTWEFTDSSGDVHAMKHCGEERSFLSKSCVETEDGSVRFEWYSWRDSVKAPSLTISRKTHSVTCDRGPMDLLQLKCKTEA